MPVAKYRMPDGSVAKIKVPQGTTDEQAQKMFEGMISDPQSDLMKDYSKRQEPSFGQRALGAAEAALTVGTSLPGAVGMAGGFLGGVAGAMKEGQFGTREAAESIQQGAMEAAGKLTYAPRTETGQKYLKQISEAAEIIPPFLPMAAQIQPFVRPASIQAKAAALPVANALAERSAPAITKAQEMGRNALARTKEKFPGVDVPEIPKSAGAAEAEIEMQRKIRAESLPAPVKLRKGQITKDPAQQQFEEETKVSYPEDVGRPIVESERAQNQAILKNFDLFTEATGAEMSGENMLRPLGRVVDEALVEYAKKRKAEINSAYEMAKQAGAMDQPVQYKSVVEYILNQTPTTRTKLAPLLQGVFEEFKKNDPENTGQISINNLEDVRKYINRHYEIGTPSEVHAVEMKKLIDAATEGQGGELYRRARSLAHRYKKEFEDVASVDKLLSQKPGTRDRRVAFEDVFDHVILKGSLDDTKNIAFLLKKGGEKGQQAWREMVGQTVDYIKSSVTRRADGAFSMAKFDAIMRDLDSSGKLDYLFGKKGAEQLRDLHMTAKDVYGREPGYLNTSKTTSRIFGVLERIKNMTKNIPIAGKAAESAADIATKNALKKQVNEAINYNRLL